MLIFISRPSPLPPHFSLFAPSSLSPQSFLFASLKTHPLTQVCVSPDYILVPRSHQDAFVAAIQKAYKQFYPDGALESSSTLTAVHASAQERVKGLIARTKGEIVAGGKEKDGRIEPTVVKNVDVKDALMEG